ncbi:unnamed protein product [Prunus armeniaca]
MSGMGEIDAREIALVMQRKDEVPVQLLLHDSLSTNPFSPFFLLQTSFYHNFHSTTPILVPLSPLGLYERALQDKCVLGEWWSLLRSSLKVEDYFGAVKVKNLPWAEPTENSE